MGIKKSLLSDGCRNENVKPCQVWFYGAGGTEGEKFIRIDYDTDNISSSTSSFLAAIEVLKNLAPTLVTPRHVFRIIQDFKNSRIILFLEPGDRKVVPDARFEVRDSLPSFLHGAFPSDSASSA
jgi:hypothetical protein